MNLFGKANIQELKEVKAKYASLETEFSNIKNSFAAMELERTSLISEKQALVAQLEQFKQSETNLKAELEAKVSEISALKANEKTASDVAVLELQKIGQAPIAQAVVKSDDKDLWEQCTEIKDAEQRRAFYLKNIKGKK